MEQQIYEALTIAADVVCELKCPSHWITGHRPPHSDECKKVQAARSAWMTHCAVQDLMASDGIFPEYAALSAMRNDLQGSGSAEVNQALDARIKEVRENLEGWLRSSLTRPTCNTPSEGK